MTTSPAPDHEVKLKQWITLEANAEAMIPVIGHLYRERGIKLTIFGISLVNVSAIDIIKAHRRSKFVLSDHVLTPSDTLPLVEAISRTDLQTTEIDLGLLWQQYEEGRKMGSEHCATMEAFLAYQISSLRGSSDGDALSNGLTSPDSPDSPLSSQSRDVVLFGFGRIGRLVARVLIGRTGGGQKLRLRAVVLRKIGDIGKRAALFKRDSIHGRFNGHVKIDAKNSMLVVNGNMIHLIESPTQTDINYTKYGIKNAILVDNTGIFRTHESLSRHLSNPGISRVVLTAPSKDDQVPNIVMGVNDEVLQPNHSIVAAASCTTNAVCPVLSSINERFGVNRGHIETIHSYTNDQNLTDNIHKKFRRGRAAALNMVITSTGAADAVGRVIPALEGKLSGNAVRVPTPNVSLAILMLQLNESVDKTQLNAFLRSRSLRGRLQSQVDYMTNKEVCSSDLVGNHHASIVDATATLAKGRYANIYVWYDNEFGYSCQVVRLLARMGGIVRRRLPARL